MGKLSVVACTDGNFNIHSEHGESEAAIMEFLQYARLLHGDKDTKFATVKILDENLDVYEGYIEVIKHETT